MSKKLRALAKNPLVVIPPLVLLLAIGWQQYTYAGRDLSLPQGVNLLPGGTFSQFGVNGVPEDWHITTSGSLQYEAGQSDGYAGGQAFKVSVSQYQSGDVAVASAKASVVAGKTYLFKGYYTANAPFTLLERIYHTDGTSTLRLVQTYGADQDDWSTASDAFKPAAGDTAVQFVYRLYSNGYLKLNSLYLEPRQDVYIPPTWVGTNLIPNSQLTVGDNDSPAGWSTYHGGTNTASFSYLQDVNGPYTEAQVANYTSGEAKWQYPPQTVKPREYYQFKTAYQSDSGVPVIVEYVLQDGTRQYQTIAQLSPADQWTIATATFEVPPLATTMFISLPLQHNGTVSTRNYQLLDITKTPATHWPGPAISLTFDGGRYSQYENALPILQHNGFRATFYINPSTIETRGFMTAEQLTDLSASGDEIGARGYNPNDMTAINNDALDYQLHEGRDYLHAAGFQVNDFAAPFGRSDAEVQYYARQYFSTLRGTDSGINTWQNLDPYNLKVLNISSATTPQKLQSALATAKAEGGWLILVYQGVGDSDLQQSPNAPHINITTAAFQQQMDLIKKSGLTVSPIATAYADITGPEK